MNILDTIISGIIALIFNILVHNIISVTCKDMPFDDKITNGSTMMLVSGIIGIIVSYVSLKENKKYTDSVVSMGLGIGGALLLLTSLISNWSNIPEKLKLSMTIITFLIVVYICYSLYD